MSKRLNSRFKIYIVLPLHIKRKIKREKNICRYYYYTFDITISSASMILPLLSDLALSLPNINNNKNHIFSLIIEI